MTLRLSSFASTAATIFILFCSTPLHYVDGADSNRRQAATEPQRPLTVKVAAIQCSSVLGDVDGNRKKLTALITEAAGEGAKVIVLPEAAITGYLSQDLKTNWRLKGWPIEAEFRGKDPLPFAETVPGPSTAHFCELAKRLQVYITVPLVEKAPADAADRSEPKKPPRRNYLTRSASSLQRARPWPIIAS